MRAIVVFHGGTYHPLAWMLHRDFRHCFVVLASDAYWIGIEGNDGMPAVKVLAGSDFDLAAHYRERGYRVVETEQRRRGDMLIAVGNCVGLVKAVLGVRAPWVWTPRQLYRCLRRRAR